MADNVIAWLSEITGADPTELDGEFAMSDWRGEPSYLRARVAGETCYYACYSGVWIRLAEAPDGLTIHAPADAALLGSA